MTLTEFLAARLAEDWRAARDTELVEGLDGSRATRDIDAHREILAEWEDPAAVRDLSLHPDADPQHPPQDGRDPDEIEEQVSIAETIDHHVRLLAAVYSDHPDYREEWRP